MTNINCKLIAALIAITVCASAMRSRSNATTMRLLLVQPGGESALAGGCFGLEPALAAGIGVALPFLEQDPFEARIRWFEKHVPHHVPNLAILRRSQPTQDAAEPRSYGKKPCKARTSKPAGPGNPRLGRFDSFAASWLEVASGTRWLSLRFSSMRHRDLPAPEPSGPPSRGRMKVKGPATEMLLTKAEQCRTTERAPPGCASYC